MAFNNHIVMKSSRQQGGTALVEFAIVLMVFCALVFAIIEFAMATFNWSRMVQATHAGARYAITNDPACDVFDYREDESYLPSCDDGSLADTCTVGAHVQRKLDSSDCGAGENDAGCNIVREMQRYSPYVLTGDSTVTVKYALRLLSTSISDAGASL